MCLNNPDCSVDVVDATVMKRCAAAPGANAIASVTSTIRASTLLTSMAALR
jgi:hypothetical protein